MEFTSGKIEGVTVEKLVKYVDESGFLLETFRKDTLPGGLAPQMGYVSYTEPGIARGPHEHREQADIFNFIGPGNFRIHLWDNREDSPTNKNRMIIFGGEDNPLLVVVPLGVVHGYKNVSRTVRGMVLNYPDRAVQEPRQKGGGRRDQARRQRGCLAAMWKSCCKNRILIIYLQILKWTSLILTVSGSLQIKNGSNG